MPASFSSPAPGSPEAEMMLQARRAERQRIAQLLHDSVSQSLTATYLQAMVLTQKLRKEGTMTAESMAGLADMLHQTVLELRGITQQLTVEEEVPPEPSS